MELPFRLNATQKVFVHSNQREPSMETIDEQEIEFLDPDKEGFALFSLYHKFDTPITPGEYTVEELFGLLSLAHGVDCRKAAENIMV